jgi:hypothetical protein
MPNKNNTNKFSMYPASAISFTSLDLARYSEIPDSIHSYHPQALTDLKNENKYLAQASNFGEKFLLAQKSSLISREAGYIANRLKRYQKINFINLHQYGLKDSLDLITPLLEQGRLAKYIMAGLLDTINQEWISIAKTHASNYNINLEAHSIQANFDMHNYLSKIRSLIDVNEDHTNLFFLGESALGNYLNPARMLKNICDSMNCGDYLAISQDVYKPNSESFWIGNYINFLTPKDNFTVSKKFANDLSQDCPIDVVWEEKNGFRGVKFRIEIQEPVRFAGVNLKEKQQVDILRCTRFTERELKKMALSLDFRIIQIIYGDSMDTALLILEKI